MLQREDKAIMEKTCKKRVCLVTDEIMPFTRGGIGAFTRNILDTHSGSIKFTILISSNAEINQQLWQERYPTVALYRVSDLSSSCQDQYDWEERYVHHPFLAKSMLIFRALLELDRDGAHFDFIEFLDWGGPGFLPIQFKMCGLWQTRAILAVRIHCTESILRNYEFRHPDRMNNIIFDIERKALADADIVVASLQPIAAHYAEFYDFGNEWLEKVLVESPPIQIERGATSVVKVKHDTDVVFSSKLQDVKRPRLFLNGALLFMARNEDYKGNIIFAAFKANDSALGAAFETIPETYSSRVNLLSDLTDHGRNTLIAKSVVVFPNVFEAFCFAAYEASLSGAIVVLNASNPAFGEDSPWKEGLNCFKFDGTASDLADVLEKIFANASNDLAIISPKSPLVPYWNTVPTGEHGVVVSDTDIDDTISLTVYVMHRNQAKALELTISCLLLEQIRINIVIVDDASSDADALLTLHQIEDEVRGIISTKQSPIRVGWGALLNSEIRNCKSDFVCVMPAGATVTIGALGAFIDALRSRPAYDVILPTSALLSSSTSSEPLYIFHPLGESLASGGLANTYAAHLFVARTSSLFGKNLSEDVSNNYEWEILRRLALSGTRMLIWPMADVNYFDESIRCHETYKIEDFAFNLDLVSKAQRLQRGYGLFVDNPHAPMMQIQSGAHDRIVEYVGGTSELAVADIKMNDAEYKELQIRRQFARAESKPKGLIRRLARKVSLRNGKFRAHVDSMLPSAESGDDILVTIGSRLKIEGWAFGVVADRFLLAEIVLRQGAHVERPEAIKRFSRLDVSYTFSVPEEFCSGFSCIFDTKNLTPGNYNIVILYMSGNDVVGRRIVKSITLV
ncbi:glycosyltransferase [Methylorubrum thiocyanatum]|uniref:glycosyltransferase n=1 Tax=Methylorubrum thiocyanatum TaxID=47958 RepID=UPI003650B619